MLHDLDLHGHCNVAERSHRQAVIEQLLNLLVLVLLLVVAVHDVLSHDQRR